MSFRSILALALGAAAALGLSAQVARAQDEGGREAAVKAAFLYNFAKFTEWPARRFDGGKAPVIFCVGAQSRLREAVEALEGKPVRARAVHVVVLTGNADPSPCHVLFVDDNSPPGLRRAVETHQVSGVLTVSDIPDFALSGGDIGLFYKGNQLRFQINLANARSSDLTFSSQLLQLADVIGPQSGSFAAIPVAEAIAAGDPSRRPRSPLDG